MLIPQPQGGILLGIPQPPIQLSYLGKHWEEDVGLFGLALQSDSSNCLMLILHRQLGNYLLSSAEGYGPTAQHIYNTIYNVGHLSTSWLLTKSKDSMLHKILVQLCSSDICWKKNSI